MMDWKSHLIVAPILLPLVTAAVLLLIDERSRKLKMAINSLSTLGLIGIACTLVVMASEKRRKQSFISSATGLHRLALCLCSTDWRR